MKKIIQMILDENRSVHERLFVFLSSVSLLFMLIAFFVELIIGNSDMIAPIGIAFAVFSGLVIFGIRKNKMNQTAIVIALLLILVLLPLTFFYGGAIYGGSPQWFVFSTLFISLIVYGKIKYFLLTLEAVTALVCYVVSYQNPTYVAVHTVRSAYVGSYISIVFVGLMLSLIVGFEIRVLKRETERSNEKSRKIEELNQSQNRFFSSMSHEIRTPINTIIGLNEMILREDISDEVAENARNIQSASGILLSLINDILDMSKMESGRMEIVPVMYDVGKMLSDIVNMISVTAEKKDLAFSVEVDPTMPAQLISDEVRIKQILINLLNNAVKYTKAGSVSLSVHCRKTGSNTALVTYSVEDTGIGIRKENIPHLFDAFKRVDERKNRYIEGTGLGLSIVRQLVDLLGGQISVNSIYTQGSTFAVSIEQETAGDQEIGIFSVERFHGSGGRAEYGERFEAPKAHVLIVDDNTTNLLVAEKLLRRTRVQTETAESGEQCLKMTLQTHYDLILMDHMMPGMDGVECLHAVREQTGGLCRETPMIVLTANAGSEDQALYRREGFDAYLLKPVDAALLEETMLNLLPPVLVKRKGTSAASYVSGEPMRAVKRKLPLIITTDSVADLPHELTESLNIPIMPFKIYTEHGVFDDGLETDGDVLLRAVREENMNARSECPSVEEYEAFFAEQLSRAQNIIHISISKRLSGGFASASEAALAFYNVHVLDSAHLSSGIGLMVLEAVERIKEEPFVTADEVCEECEKLKKQIQTSFVIENTDALRRSGRLSERMSRFCTAFMIHPMLVMRDGNMTVADIFLGSLTQARRSYIKKILRAPESIETDTLFITYAGMRLDEIERIRDYVQEIVRFDKVYLQKASPAISANSGEGTFGLLFKRKHNE